MNDIRIDVVATTISGSLKDWGKVKHIVPLFEKQGFSNVSLYSVDKHEAVRSKVLDCIREGSRIIISAGGSGTFNRALEGCCDSGVDLKEIRLGFLRKGSADLIGKVLGMPDDIEEAISVFANSINKNITAPCDIIQVESAEGDEKPRRFAGYGGAEIFGRIPIYTENRYIKYYKGILSQFFGDMGPFFVGAVLSSTNKMFKKRLRWKIIVDQQHISSGRYQALIIANGDLGKNMPLARGVSLGSGDFYLFGLQDKGMHKIIGQFKHTWDASVLENPRKWGFETYCIKDSLQLQPDSRETFYVNVDGSAMKCQGSVAFRIIDQINLIAK